MLWPQLYRGELVAGNIIRGCRWNGLSYSALFIQLTDGHRTSDGWLISGLLPSLSELLRTKADVMLNRHTVFPYMTASQSPDIRKKLANELLTIPQLAGKTSRASSLTGMYGAVPFRQFCDACRQAELTQYGESYWHVEHHLPGVLLCPRHGQTLCQTDVPTLAARGNDLLGLPEDYVANPVSTFGVRRDVLVAIANESMKLLKGEILDESSYRQNRQAAIQLGYSIQHREDLSSFALAAQGRKLFGTEFLARLKCSIGHRSPWLAVMFRSQRHLIFSVVKHVLARAFLSVQPMAEELATSHRPGLLKTDTCQLDMNLSARLSYVLEQLQHSSERISVAELLRRAGRQHEIRHMRHELPLVNAVIEQFKCSRNSLHQKGGRS